jgi:Zn-dependent peptidase ImmA (M78 family)
LTYEELQDLYNDVLIVEADLSGVNGLKGLYIDGCIAIEKSLTDAEKSCVLAEEIGHHLTSSGDILDQRKAVNRKQEHKAMMFAYDLQVGIDGIIEAYEAGCVNLYTMAEHMGLSECFLKLAIESYRKKYGLCVKHREYIVYFEPSLGVMRLI